MAQFFTFVSYCVLFWSAAAILTSNFNINKEGKPKFDGTSVFTCIFCIMFGAFAAGNA